MMSIHCPRHGHEVLIGHRQILGIEGHGHDLTVSWVCWCGQHGTSRPGAERIPAASVPTTAQAA
jgi:hypothetical protein